jgi:hypothetical protein
MRKHLRHLAPALAALALSLPFAACGGGDSGPAGPDVYVAGHAYYGNYPGSVTSATLWTNGKAQRLSDERSDDDNTLSVYASGGDVYVAGTEGTYYDDNFRATLWTNGKAERLSDEYSVASSVYASGGNVYVAGREGGNRTNLSGARPALWVNGEPQTLEPLNNDHYWYAFARSVFVSGDDVYVVGRDSSCATLWVNGEPQELSYGSWTHANSVFVSDGKVYVAGTHELCATLWVDGEPHRLSEGYSEANSVYVSGGKVYVAGSDNSNGGATLWVDGEVQELADEYGYAGMEADSVCVSGGDVYVTGNYHLWKNGVDQRWNQDEMAFFHSVFAK